MTDSPFPGFQRPNSTDTPDEWYLQVAPRIRHISEMKVVLYIIYRTFGWRKWDDWISLSQFEHGQQGRESDNGCGLSHAAVLEGLEYAVADGYARCRLLCPHCSGEVERTEIEQRPWRNRHGTGTKDVPVVPQECPHCAKPLRGLERPYYRLAFADEVVDAYAKPQDWLAKYNQTTQSVDGEQVAGGGKVENSSSTKVEKSSPQVENSSSTAQKLGISTSHSTLHSTRQSTGGGGDLLSDLVGLTGLKQKTAQTIIERYGPQDAARWLAFALEHGDDPAAYLVACCIKKRSVAHAYTAEQVELILDRFRQKRNIPIYGQGGDSTAAVVELAQPDDSLRSVIGAWDQCKAELRLQMTRVTFDTWLGVSELVAYDPGTNQITIQLRDQYACEWLSGRWLVPIKRTLAAILDIPLDDLSLRFIPREPDKPPPKVSTPPDRSRTRPDSARCRATSQPTRQKEKR